MKTILLVEDNDDIREMVGELLRQEGYQTCEAENGVAALAKLASLEEPPCLVLLDLAMPVMDGVELLRILQRTGRAASLPIIVLSAGGERSDVPAAREFMRKPINPELLIALIREVCGAPS